MEQEWLHWARKTELRQRRNTEMDNNTKVPSTKIQRYLLPQEHRTLLKEINKIKRDGYVVTSVCCTGKQE